MTNTANTAEQLPLFDGATVYKTANIDEILAAARIQRAQAIQSLINDVVTLVKKFFRVRKTMRTLENLSDAVLADIGIERDQIASISHALANGTYNVETAPSATVTTLPLNDADTTNEKQGDLPLAA